MSARAVRIEEPAFSRQPLPADCVGDLYLGDNLIVMRALAERLRGAVDLVYIDPPFSTNNVFLIDDGRANSISASGRVAYRDDLSGEPFLAFLRERLALLRELMSARASIYLHIDDKVGYEVKAVMDDVFGRHNFRAAVARVKCNPKNFRRKNYGNIKDSILFYTKNADYVWNEPRVEISESEIDLRFGKVDAAGRHYATTPLHAPGETKNGETGKPWRGVPPPQGRHWRCPPRELERLDKVGLIEWSANGVPRKIIYAQEAARRGKALQDVWFYKDPQNPAYPTEKNAQMLRLIVEASSPPGGLVMDCFAGSGAALLQAQKAGRRFVGIDSSLESTRVICRRFENGEAR